MMTEIEGNLDQVRSAIATAAEKSGRHSEDIQLVAVSKTHPAESVHAALDAGQMLFGESRVQEARAKIPLLPSSLRWHFIGVRQRKQIRRLILVCLMLWLGSPFAHGSMWSDPDWEQMLRESKVIALVEVVQGGKYVAKVKPLTLFKGEIGSEFYVTKFNNNSWPDEAIAIESFKEKQRYCLFLRQDKDDVFYLEFLSNMGGAGPARILSDLVTAFTGWRFGNPEYEASLNAAKGGLLWSVWTPTAGDLPVNSESVSYSLLRTSFANGAPKHDLAEFERFLRAAIAFQDRGQTEPGFLEETLAGNAGRGGEAGEGPCRSQRSRAPVGELLPGRWRAYDPVFKTIAKGDDVDARFALARLLGAVAEKRADQLLRAMLATPTLSFRENR